MAIGVGLIRLKTEEKREKEKINKQKKKRSTGKKEGHKRRPVEQDKQLIKRRNKGQQSEWGTKAQRINKTMLRIYSSLGHFSEFFWINVHRQSSVLTQDAMYLYIDIHRIKHTRDISINWPWMWPQRSKPPCSVISQRCLMTTSFAKELSSRRKPWLWTWRAGYRRWRVGGKIDRKSTENPSLRTGLDNFHPF